MSSEERKVHNVLLNASRRVIVRFARLPKTSDELRLKVRTQASKSYSRTELGKDLDLLENVGAITHHNGVWTSSKIAIQVLNKYFGYNLEVE